MKHILIIVTLLLQFFTIFCENSKGLSVMEEFEKGMAEFYVPELLARNVPSHDFLEKISEAVSSIGNDFLAEYRQQAFRAQETLVRDIKSATEDVLSNCGSPEKLENELIRVNKLTKMVIDCIPGNVMIKRKSLPDLPENQKEIQTHLGNEKLSTIFVNLAQQVDSDFDNILNIINGIYISGWKRSRLSLNNLQDRFRNEYLNGIILPTFSKELLKIHKSKNVEENVTRNTWNEFLQFYSTIENAEKSLKNT